jgi:hypothetical protein
MSWLDAFFAPKYQTIQIAGVPLPQENALNFFSGFTAADNPSNGSTDITGTGGGGGGGWTVLTSTTASHATPSRATWLILWCNSSAGSYTQALPTAPNSGDRVTLKDVGATSATTGIFANAITISGTSINVQDQHTMAISGTSYVWGQASGDGGGSVLDLQYNGVEWMVFL